VSFNEKVKDRDTAQDKCNTKKKSSAWDAPGNDRLEQRADSDKQSMGANASHKMGTR
jgi:hypothetical protein